jgi:quercetin dioxygenase-like cupin family protein
MPTPQLKAQHSPGRTYWMVGDRATVELAGSETGGKLALISFLVVPGGGPPPHTHGGEDETFFVVEGDVVFYVGNSRLAAKPGDVIHVPQGTLHRFANESTRNARFLVIIAPAGLEGFFEEAGIPCAVDDIHAPPADEVRKRQLKEVGRRWKVEFL